MTLRWLGWSALAVAVTFGAGWFVGASGRSVVEQDRRRAEQRADFAEARALVLQGRVSLFQSNFGEANRHFNEALGRIERAQTRLRQLGEATRAGELEVALAQLREAQRLSLALDASAQATAATALRVIEAVASATESR